VELDKQDDALLRAFEHRVMAEGDVLACYEVSGESTFC
jgi:Lrp/AsnC family leucine-responsive transcriptional regulator